MKFLVDAQLPKRFCVWLNQAGHDAIHTLDLPEGNRTTDDEIIAFSEQQERIVITKDDDFVQSYLIQGRPSRLLLVSTGNISNDELERSIQKHLASLGDAFDQSRFVELGQDILVVHE
jgi:predicted nuclease of predicted toxin-antitoxin system